MSDFAKTWDNMNLRERIAHLLADWQQSKNTNDPMVLRIAATMAHHQLEEADADIVALTAERDEARQEVCGLLVACHTDPDDDKPDPNLKHIHAGIRGWDCFKEDKEDTDD